MHKHIKNPVSRSGEEEIKEKIKNTLKQKLYEGKCKQAKLTIENVISIKQQIKNNIKLDVTDMHIL
jgi:hypothetical protein